MTDERMTDLKTELDRLSEAATQGEWELVWTELHGKRYGPPNIKAEPRLMSGSGGARSWTDYVVENRFCADDEEANLDFIAALVNAYRSGQLQVVPEGHVVVPREPTEVMLQAMGRAYDHPSVFMAGASQQGLKTAARVYRAMIAATEGGTDA